MARLIISFLLFSLLISSCKQTDKEINFKRIIFRTSHCEGTCPVYDLQLDGDKRIKLHTEAVYLSNKFDSDLDTSKIGYFLGVASDTTYNKLNNIIKSINIQNLNFDKSANCCDGSLITIIIYYNNQRKFLQSMFPPAKANKLISTLYEVCEHSKLKRTKDKFTIEDE